MSGESKGVNRKNEREKSLLELILVKIGLVNRH